MPKRPPKYWFRKCVKKIKAGKRKISNPAAICGWLWFHKMKPETRVRLLKEEKKLSSVYRKRALKRSKTMKKYAASPYKIGDIVKYTSKFLRNTGQYTGVPINGKVIGYSDMGDSFVKVMWSDGYSATVNVANIMPAKNPDYSSRSRKSPEQLLGLKKPRKTSVKVCRKYDLINKLYSAACGK